MDIKYLEKFCEEKGKKIATILLNDYDAADFEVHSSQIEGEIYDISVSYSKILFFEAESFLDQETRNKVKSHVHSRFDISSKELGNMKDIDLIAHWIKSQAINSLNEKDVMLA